MWKKTLKKIIPESVLNLRHYYYALYGAVKYHHPSEEIFVIMITGTSGKSSTVHLLRQILESAGFHVGSLSTVDFYIDGEMVMNDRKMTMLGKSDIQMYLRRMVDAGCDIAILEATSEGALQHRHRFINFDLAIFTNLYPEHIEAHGSFENYKKAKLSIFKYISRSKRKKASIIKKLPLQKCFGADIEKIAIVNGNSEHSTDFLNLSFEKRVTYGRADAKWFVPVSGVRLVVKAEDISVTEHGLRFIIDSDRMDVRMYGEYNIMNILAAIATTRSLNIDRQVIKKAVEEFHGVPGRVEFIEEARELKFDVIVDYAFEPVAIEALYKVVNLLSPSRIIHVFGSTGGGRDVSRRYSVGKYVGEHADICIVTDEDPYDDDPMSIMVDVAGAVEQAGRVEGESLFIITDRGEAIEHAISIAEAGDIVLVTGKGSEQKMCVADGKLIDWDDREEVRRAIKLKKA
jgi:UDP-N-acetylmuramoyl-L-alanyl-D-glutamate--2,6-diaminopimelate ligase